MPAKKKIRDPRKRAVAAPRSTEDWRTDAQTDMDRIWYAPEFRRLGGITQVVPPQDEYMFHDRLMHSIKVAQVAATLARMHLYRAEQSPLKETLAEAGIQIEDWVDSDHCYAAGLAHDIGHPPFGHAGEHLLQQLHEGEGRVLNLLHDRSFEGNAQSMRIVASLSFRKEEQDGLNLTLRTLAAIAKYPWTRGQHPHTISKLRRKWSFYPQEDAILKELIEHKFVRVVKAPLPAAQKSTKHTPVVTKVYRWTEAEIMDWADDISYAVHDVEDFFRAGRIPLDRVAAVLGRADESMYRQPKTDEHDRRRDWLTTAFEFASDDEEVMLALRFARDKMAGQLDRDGQSIADQIPDAFVAIGSHLLERMPGSRFDGSLAAHSNLQNFGSRSIIFLSENTSLEVMPFKDDKRLVFTVAPIAQLVAEFFKALCRYFVIETSAVATMQRGQAASLERLITNLCDVAEKWSEDGRDMNIRTLPARLREYLVLRAEAEGGDLDRSAVRMAVIDYVCGLRDLQAMTLEARLSGDVDSLALASNWLDS